MNGEGGGEGWTERMAESVFIGSHLNFNMYMVGGDIHCTLPIGDFYTGSQRCSFGRLAE